MDKISVELTPNEISTINLILSEEAKRARKRHRFHRRNGHDGAAQVCANAARSFSETIRTLDNAKLAALEGTDA